MYNTYTYIYILYAYGDGSKLPLCVELICTAYFGPLATDQISLAQPDQVQYIFW